MTEVLCYFLVGIVREYAYFLALIILNNNKKFYYISIPLRADTPFS